ncbi:MAG: large-conductance mechanosensitive channel protein MscL [Candidatus Nomurabacteria bacterium]|jgi:large conductance mechanosensitive channel|nr:large-conductance mechanosensitive channel protein MscL [Candidatus Nomurabacteria bacterium]
MSTKGIKDLTKVADPKAGLKAAKSFSNEFKAFISRGNVVDLAVGVIIGAAFGKIVSSLVSDILMPVAGMIMGGLNFSELTITVGDADIKYGNFIQSVIDFLIIAAAIFVFVKVLTNMQMRVKKPQAVEEKKLEKTSDEQITILRDIRDELKKGNRER